MVRWCSNAFDARRPHAQRPTCGFPGGAFCLGACHLFFADRDGCHWAGDVASAGECERKPLLGIVAFLVHLCFGGTLVEPSPGLERWTLVLDGGVLDMASRRWSSAGHRGVGVCGSELRTLVVRPAAGRGGPPARPCGVCLGAGSDDALKVAWFSMRCIFAPQG